MKIQNRIRNVLLRFSGDDYDVIRNCNIKDQNKFAAIGLFVIAIFGLCFVSSFLAFSNFFDSNLIGIAISLFFSSTTITIYLLLNYTLTKNTLPQTKNQTKSDILAKVLSPTIRVGFVCFIALLVSKPLEYKLLSFHLIPPTEITIIKKKQLDKYIFIIQRNYQPEILELENAINKLQLTNINSNYISRYKYLKDQLIADKNKHIIGTWALILSSPHYLDMIVKMSLDHPICWLMSLITMVIFLGPIISKNLVAQSSSFYDMKKELELNLIISEYALTEQRLIQTYQNTHNFSMVPLIKYLDPPFNTEPYIDKRLFLNEDELVKDLYGI